MIAKIKIDDIPQVVKIHRQELPGFLSELGEDFLKKFYDASLDIPEIFTLVEKENEQVLGFVTGATRVKGLYKEIIFRDVFSFIWLILNNLITHPKNIVKMAKILAYPGFAEDIPEILTIVVSKSHQGKGIGKKLWTEAVKEFQKRGFKKFRVSIYDRLPANEFYKKMGCRFEKSFQFLGEKMNYYLYIIRD